MTTPINKTTPSARELRDILVQRTGCSMQYAEEAIKSIASISWDAGYDRGGQEAEYYSRGLSLDANPSAPEKKTPFLTNLFKE